MKIAELLNNIKLAAVRNAIRLFRDACIVSLSGSNESPFTLAILAYEEIGKAAIADRHLDLICQSPNMAREVEISFNRSGRQHTTKQASAAFESGTCGLQKYSNLDSKKQAAIYTDISNGKVVVPPVTKREFVQVISEVYRALNDIGDLAYSGFQAIGNSKSEWLHRSDIEKIEDLYKQATSL